MNRHSEDRKGFGICAGKGVSCESLPVENQLIVV
jgi:hypothetical protein